MGGRGVTSLGGPLARMYLMASGGPPPSPFPSSSSFLCQQVSWALKAFLFGGTARGKKKKEIPWREAASQSIKSANSLFPSRYLTL